MSGNKYSKKEEIKSLARVGYDVNEDKRSGSFVQEDDNLTVNRSVHDGVDIMRMEDALRKYPQAGDYYGKAFAEAKKDYPKDTRGGYFIRVKKGSDIAFPVQSCLYLKKENFKQRVHNLIIAEPGSRLHIITGCTAAEKSEEAYHLGVSEFFVEEGAYLNFTMIHSWEKDVSVEPKSAAIVKDGGTFISNYICLDPVKNIKMYPTAILGKSCKAHFSSLMVARENTFQDIGSRVIFKDTNSSAEIISRAVSLGGTIIARGHLKSESKGSKAHLECRGLLVNEKGKIHAVPELETYYRDVDMSHEAAIGKTSKEEVEYLCARGIPREEAQSLIVRGFVDTDILALPESLKKEIDNLADRTLKSGL